VHDRFNAGKTYIAIHISFKIFLSLLHGVTLLKRQLGTGRMAQVIEHLPSKCEVLSSNHSSTKQKKKEWDNQKNEKNFTSIIKICYYKNLIHLIHDKYVQT
jgi:hypothetical protein